MTEMITGPRIGPHPDNPCPSRTWQSSPYEQEHQCGLPAGHTDHYHRTTVRIDEHSIRTYCWGPQATDGERS